MSTVLLTGAGGGIGKAIKEKLEEAGFAVISVERSDADLTSFSDVEKLEATIAKEHPSTDWVVAAHGYVDTEMDFEKQDPKEMQKTFEVNVLSLLYLAKIFVKHIPNGGGMIFLSSTAALSKSGRTLAYSASKGAVNTLAQSLARNKPDLNIFSVCPGPTNTEMRERLAHDAASKQSPDVVADTILKIVSGASGYQTGDIIEVKDGVESLHSHLD